MYILWTKKRKKGSLSCLKICLNPLSALPGDGEDCKGTKCTEFCPEGWVEKQGSCYFWARTDKKKTWEEAQQFCRNEGGQLPVALLRVPGGRGQHHVGDPGSADQV